MITGKKQKYFLFENYRITKVILMAVITMTLFMACSNNTESLTQDQQDDQAVHTEGDLGEVNFNVPCNGAVREDFDYALGMMHHMMYETSRELFEHIIEADPNCAMGYWGVATTLFQPLWSTWPSLEDMQKGSDLIKQAQDLVDSEREELLIESTAAFFGEPETADLSDRLQSWADIMEVAYEAYPDDHDIAALYGLTRLSNAQFVENRDPLHDEAEAVLRDIFKQEPKHPGAIHYSIHATDVDGQAENALDMVDAYGEIAPDVPHALHMASHIYVRLGDWPEVIEWNSRSAEAALDHPVNGAESHHYIHAIDYMVYGHLQRGEEDEAEAAFAEALDRDKHQASFISAFHLAAIPARLAVEQQNWEQAIALEPRTPEYLPWDDSPWAEGLTWYARGLGSIHTGDLEGAQEAERQLEQFSEQAKENGDEGMAKYIQIDRHVLAGRIAHAQGEDNRAVEMTQAAADMEETIEKHPVTPGALLPPYEALGILLTDLERHEEALEAFEASDEIWPNRYYTLAGAARAAELADNQQIAQQYYEKLLAITGDTNRAAVREAEGFMARAQ